MPFFRASANSSYRILPFSFAKELWTARICDDSAVATPSVFTDEAVALGLSGD